MVVGGSGSGKTTVARCLAERNDVHYIELDALLRGPNWTACPHDEFRTRVEDAISGDAWVADGNYTGQLGDIVLERAELVVWLDLPLRVTFPSALATDTAADARSDRALGRQPRNLARCALQPRLALPVGIEDESPKASAIREELGALPDGATALRSEIQAWLGGAS